MMKAFEKNTFSVALDTNIYLKCMMIEKDTQITRRVTKACDNWRNNEIASLLAARFQARRFYQMPREKHVSDGR